MTKKPFWVVLGILFLILLLIPALLVFSFKLTIAPQCKLKVVDSNNQPIPHAWVRDIWQQYSLEETGHEQDIILDDQGCVLLPERFIQTNLISLISGAIKNFKTYRVHAGYCSSSYIMVIAPGYEGQWFDLYPNKDVIPVPIILSPSSRQKNDWVEKRWFELYTTENQDKK
jgi:hypothetical protein